MIASLNILTKNAEIWQKMFWQNTNNMIQICLVKIYKKWGCKRMGDINVYTGPMKCGKTQRILDKKQLNK